MLCDNDILAPSEFQELTKNPKNSDEISESQVLEVMTTLYIIIFKFQTGRDLPEQKPNRLQKNKKSISNLENSTPFK